jgi:hypothetical protein
MDVRLREVQDSDLDILWAQLSDPELQRMAAFTRDYHYGRGEFDARWHRVRANASVTLRASRSPARHKAYARACDAEIELVQLILR